MRVSFSTIIPNNRNHQTSFKASALKNNKEDEMYLDSIADAFESGRGDIPDFKATIEKTEKEKPVLAKALRLWAKELHIKL